MYEFLSIPLMQSSLWSVHLCAIVDDFVALNTIPNFCTEMNVTETETTAYLYKDLI